LSLIELVGLPVVAGSEFILSDWTGAARGVFGEEALPVLVGSLVDPVVPNAAAPPVVVPAELCASANVLESANAITNAIVLHFMIDSSWLGSSRNKSPRLPNVPFHSRIEARGPTPRRREDQRSPVPRTTGRLYRARMRGRVTIAPVLTVSLVVVRCQRL
jgi:hypothetical protein